MSLGCSFFDLQFDRNYIPPRASPQPFCYCCATRKREKAIKRPPFIFVFFHLPLVFLERPSFLWSTIESQLHIAKSNFTILFVFATLLAKKNNPEQPSRFPFFIFPRCVLWSRNHVFLDRQFQRNFISSRVTRLLVCYCYDTKKQDKLIDVPPRTFMLSIPCRLCFLEPQPRLVLILLGPWKQEKSNARQTSFGYPCND